MGRRDLGMKKYSKDVRSIHKSVKRRTKGVNKNECDHNYSDGTGTGWHVCTKCGDMY